MKFKLFMSATLALMLSSAAVASSSGLGQQLGRISNPIATQCTLVDKPQAESKSSDRSKDDSDRDSGRRSNNGEAA